MCVLWAQNLGRTVTWSYMILWASVIYKKTVRAAEKRRNPSHCSFRFLRSRTLDFSNSVSKMRARDACFSAAVLCNSYTIILFSPRQHNTLNDDTQNV